MGLCEKKHISVLQCDESDLHVARIAADPIPTILSPSVSLQIVSHTSQTVSFQFSSLFYYRNFTPQFVSIFVGLVGLPDMQPVIGFSRSRNQNSITGRHRPRTAIDDWNL